MTNTERVLRNYKPKLTILVRFEFISVVMVNIQVSLGYTAVLKSKYLPTVKVNFCLRIQSTSSHGKLHENK